MAHLLGNREYIFIYMYIYECLHIEALVCTEFRLKEQTNIRTGNFLAQRVGG